MSFIHSRFRSLGSDFLDFCSRIRLCFHVECDLSGGLFADLPTEIAYAVDCTTSTLYSLGAFGHSEGVKVVVVCELVVSIKELGL